MARPKTSTAHHKVNTVHHRANTVHHRDISKDIKDHRLNRRCSTNKVRRLSRGGTVVTRDVWPGYWLACAVAVLPRRVVNAALIV